MKYFILIIFLLFVIDVAAYTNDSIMIGQNNTELNNSPEYRIPAVTATATVTLNIVYLPLTQYTSEQEKEYYRQQGFDFEKRVVEWLVSI